MKQCAAKAIIVVGGNCKKQFLNTNNGVKKLIPVFSDNSGHLWLSSKGMGLYQYHDGKFISYSE